MPQGRFFWCCVPPPPPQGQLLCLDSLLGTYLSLHFPMAPKEMENRLLVMETSLLSSHDPTPGSLRASDYRGGSESALIYHEVTRSKQAPNWRIISTEFLSGSEWLPRGLIGQQA